MSDAYNADGHEVEAALGAPEAVKSREFPAPVAGQGAGRIDPLTGVRFFAAISVVIYHYWQDFIPEVHTVRVFENGFMGVSFFFLLSGYILGYVYVKPGAPAIDKKTFWVHRFARIYPAFALSLLFRVPLVGSQIYHSFDPARRCLIALGTLSANLMLLQAWNLAFSWHWNPPSWSISVEAFFYLLFPVLALWSSRRSVYRKTAFLIFVCYLLMLLPAAVLLSRGIGWNDQPRPWAFQAVVFGPLFRLPEFLIGLLLYHLHRRLGDVCSPAVISRIGVVALYSGLACTAATIAISRSIPYILRYDGIADIGFAAIILGLAITRDRLCAFLSLPALVILGEASYSIYIFQSPVVEYFHLLFPNISSAGLMNQVLLFAVCVVSLIGTSMLSFKFVETPVRHKISSWYASSRAGIPDRSGLRVP